MTKLSEAKNTIFCFVYNPGKLAASYYDSKKYIECPEHIPDEEYELLRDFKGSEHFNLFEDFIMELTLEVGNETVMRALYLEFLAYTETAYKDQFLKYEPFSNDKQRFDNISSFVIDFLDWNLMEVGQFLHNSMLLLKRLIPSQEFKEHTIFRKTQDGDSIFLRPFPDGKGQQTNKGYPASLKEIALYCVYRDISISNSGVMPDDILHLLGNNKGGLKLYMNYNEVFAKSKRLALKDEILDGQKNKNFKKRLEKVIKILEVENKKEAIAKAEADLKEFSDKLN